MKRTALALALILALALSLVAGMQCVKVARADPFFIFKPVDPVPGQFHPLSQYLAHKTTQYTLQIKLLSAST